MSRAHDYIIDPADTWHAEEYSYPTTAGVSVWSRNVIERRNGIPVARRWPSGAYQVRGGGSTRTYIGETAWSDAQREYHDRALAEHRKSLAEQ